MTPQKNRWIKHAGNPHLDIISVLYGLTLIGEKEPSNLAMNMYLFTETDAL